MGLIYLYDGNTTEFEYNGKPLPKAYDVEYDFKINEEYFVSGKHPLDKEEVYQEIVEDKIIKVHTPFGQQPFRIIDVKKAMDYVEFEAWPLFMADMRNKLIKPLSLNNTSGLQAVIAFKNALIQETKFYFTSDIPDVHDYNTQDVNESESDKYQLYDALDIFKDLVARWGGEVFFDGYDVRILRRIGTNTQALLYEKKNISSFVDQKNIEGLVTRVYGKSDWTTSEDGSNEQTEHHIKSVVDSPLINEYSGLIFEKQYTNNNIRTKQEMDNWLALKFSTDNIDKPTRTIETSTNLIGGDYVSIGDTLILKYIKHNVDMTIRMIGCKYDAYEDRYLSTILGDAKQTFTQQVSNSVDAVNDSVKELKKDNLGWLKDIMKAVENSYFNEDGYNYELQVDNIYNLPAGYYSFDAPIDQNPDKVIYMGAGKLLIANSKTPTGEWIWETALDGDGINASLINTGVLNAELVQVGLNNIYSWMKLTEQGLAMEGSGGWRRSVYGAESVEYNGGYSGYNENAKAGAIGIFRTNYYDDNIYSNWFEDQDTQRMNIAMAVNYNYKLSLGYRDSETGNQRRYKTFMTFDPRYSGNSPTNLWFTPNEFYVNDNRVLKISDRLTVHAVLDMDGYEIANPSDVRLKTNIKDVDFDARQEILKAGNLKQYEWNKGIKKNADKPDGEQIGLLAQENPFFANMESEDVHYLSISLNKQVNVMFQALKDEIADHENTKRELNELKELLKEKGVI